MIPPVAWSKAVNFPIVPAGTYGVAFQTSTPDGAFAFVFKFLNGHWNGWATLPDGRIRTFGCVPDVANWTTFGDYGSVVSSSLGELGLNDLVSSTLYLLRWAE